MATSKYNLIAEECDEEHESPRMWTQQSISTASGWQLVLLALGLTIVMLSFAANAFFFYRQYYRPWDLSKELPTRFAHLRYDVPTEIVHDTDYNSLNRTIQDAAWDDPAMEPWTLFVALDEEYAVSQDLPHSQRWPWDLSKGVYIPTAAHELHCVRVLRTSVNENHDGVSQADQSWAYAHVIHCLNVVRDSVMCNADDTPLYIGRLHKNAHSKSANAGGGTIKMCRNWNTLFEWTHERSACYRPIHRHDPSFDEIERYKFCPDGTEPWKDQMAI